MLDYKGKTHEIGTVSPTSAVNCRNHRENKPWAKEFPDGIGLPCLSFVNLLHTPEC